MRDRDEMKDDAIAHLSDQLIAITGRELIIIYSIRTLCSRATKIDSKSSFTPFLPLSGDNYKEAIKHRKWMNNKATENGKVKIVEPNKGRHIAVAGDINTIVASKEDTGRTYSFIEAKVFPGGGPAPHIQTREHEGFYVVEGQVAFKVDKQRIEAKPGTFVNIPPNVLHSFKNETNEIAKVIIILSPPGMEQLFVEIGLEVSDINIKPPPFTNEQMQKLPTLAAKYGMDIKPD